MAERKENMEGLVMMLELLKRIPASRWVTIKDVQEELHQQDHRFIRSERSYQKMFRKLVNEGLIDVEDSSKPHRFKSNDYSQRLTVRSLNAKEALLLTLAEQQLRPLLPTKLMKCMDSFFIQARSQLDGKPPAHLESEWLDKVRTLSTTLPLLPPKVGPEVFQQVSDALFGNQWLDLTYKNANSKKAASYKVMPLGLVQQGQRMYIACRFYGHDDYRSLALHRIQSAAASTLTFERPADFSLSQVNEDLHFSDGPPKVVRLRFKIDKENGKHIVECPLSKDQQVVETEETYEISATVTQTDVLKRWLRGFGDAISGIVISRAKRIGTSAH
jgi:predicted DNA-binding transcriptional regulator YafY